MLYLLYGSDTYRRDGRLQQMRRAYREKNPFALGETLLDAPQELSTIEDAFAQGGGLFEEKRFLILRDVFVSHGDAFLELLKKIKAQERKDIVVVLVEGDIASEKAFLQLRALCRADEFAPLSPRRLSAWVERYAEERAPENGPRRIHSRALSMLVRLGPDLWRLSQELEKLLVFKAGEPIIEEADVRTLVALPVETSIFPIGDGMAEQKPLQALVATERFVAQGEAVEGIIGYVLKEAQNLARAHAALGTEKANGGKKFFSIHPFVWKKRMGQARRWKEQEIRTLLQRAVQLDIGWKSGRDKRLVLDAFLLASGANKE